MENKQKLCANPECGGPLKRKSRKAKYCCTPCKNRGNFLLRKVEYESEEAFTNGYRKNCRILSFLYNNGTTSPSNEVLEALKFNISALPAMGQSADGSRGLSFGKYGLKPIDSITHQIIKIK